MYDYVRIINAVPDISVGDPDFNCGEILKKIRETEKYNGDFIIFRFFSFIIPSSDQVSERQLS